MKNNILIYKRKKIINYSLLFILILVNLNLFLYGQSIEINIQPKDTSVCDGNVAKFSLKAQNAKTYQWQSSSDGKLFNNLNEGTPYKNVDKDTLEINPTDPSMNNLIYRCLLARSSDEFKFSDSVKLTINPLPSASTGSPKAICKGESTNIGAPEVSGNNYLWSSTPMGYSSSESYPYVNPTITTTYTLVETIAATGCKNTNSIIITVNPLPLANAGSPTEICNGTSTTIGSSAVSGSKYSWSASSGDFTSKISNPLVTPTVTTTYTLTETINATGCSKINTVVITVNPNPDAIITPSDTVSFCRLNDSIQLKANTGNGFKYQWLKGGTFITNATSSSYTTKITGSYTVRVTNSKNCINTSKPTVLEVDSLLPDSAGEISGKKSICKFKQSETYFVPSITNARLYLWTIPKGATAKSLVTKTNSITVDFDVNSESGEITVYGKNSCAEGEKSIMVITSNPLPAANTGKDQSRCITGDPTQIGDKAVSGSKYFWSSSPAGFTDTLSNPKVKPTITTTYTLKETITNTGCSKTNNVVVTVNMSKPDKSESIAGDNPVCYGRKLVAYNVPVIKRATYYIWRFPDGTLSTTTTNTINVDFNTNKDTVRISVRGRNACGDGDSASLKIKVNPKPKTHISGDSIICKNSAWVPYYDIKDTNIRYIWEVIHGKIQIGEFTNNIFVKWDNDADTGKVKLKQYFRFSGCDNTFELPVIFTPNSAPNPVKLTLKNSFATTLVSDKWYPNMDWGYELINNEEFLPLEIEESSCKNSQMCYFGKLDDAKYLYWVKVADANDCFTKCYYKDPQVIFSIEDLTEEINVHMYPNPNSGNFFLRFNSSESATYNMIIYDNIGKLVMQQNIKIFNKDESIEINSTGLENGFYYVELKNSKGFRIIKKMVKF